MKKIIELSSFIAVTVALIMLLACSAPEHRFTESDWEKTVNNADRSLLYAPHVKGEKYFNPWKQMPYRNFGDVLRWKFSRKVNRYTEAEKNYLPKVRKDVLESIRKLDGDRDFILWLGHNSFLVRISGQYWLTDPMLSKHAVIVRRKTDPALSIKELNSLSDHFNIIITHNHYDHLDAWTMKRLPSASRVFVPMGLKKYIMKYNKPHVVEMDWWQSKKLADNTIVTCLPAQHWSLRADMGRNRSLWAAFIVKTERGTFFFGGDSGYFPGYAEIGRRFGKIDYAFLPVTAYHPRWFMHYAHMDVKEAVKAFHELGAGYFVPTQWGTFKLGDNPAGYPGLDLHREIEKQQFERKRFLIMDIGEIVLISKKNN